VAVGREDLDRAGIELLGNLAGMASTSIALPSGSRDDRILFA
jgi:hypothetical protein